MAKIKIVESNLVVQDRIERKLREDVEYLKEQNVITDKIIKVDRVMNCKCPKCNKLMDESIYERIEIGLALFVVRVAKYKCEDCCISRNYELIYNKNDERFELDKLIENKITTTKLINIKEKLAYIKLRG